MRFNGLRGRDIGPFKGEFSVDFDAIPGRLIALAGNNGCGKSTLLECLIASLDRTTLTRGSLVDLATSRESYIESRVTNGKAWTLRQTVDGVSKKGESLVRDSDGNPATATTKVRDFDAWRAAHLPSTDVLTNSTFMAQGSSGFLELGAGERKAVLLRTLGIERYELMAEKARERLRDHKAAHDVALARLKDEQERTVDIDQAEDELAAAQAQAEAANLALVAARKAVAEAEEQVAAANAAEAEWRRATDALAAYRRTEAERVEAEQAIRGRVADLERVIADGPAASAAAAQHADLQRELAQAKVLSDRHADLASRLSRLTGERADVQARLANIGKALSRKDEIQAAGKRLAEIDVALGEVQAKVGAVELKLSALDKEVANAARASEGLQGSLNRAHQRIEAAKRTLELKHTVEAASRELPAAERSVDESVAQEKAATEEIERLASLAVDVRDRRIVGLRSGLKSIVDEALRPGPLTAEGVRADAKEALDKDNALAERAKCAPKQLADARARHTRVVEDLELGRDTMARIKAIVAKAPMVAEAEKDLAMAQEELAAIAELNGAEKDRELAALEAIRETDARRQALWDERDDLKEERAKIEPLAALGARVVEAEAKLGERTAELARITSEMNALVDESDRLGPLPNVRELEDRIAQTAWGLAAEKRVTEAEARLSEVSQQAAKTVEALAAHRKLGPPAVPTLPRIDVRLPSVKEACARAEREAGQALATVAVLQAKVESAKLGARKLAELEAQRKAIETEISDWTLLADALGPQGIPALEIDAAGPELTGLVNDLLHGCASNRWTVSIETSRASSDGKKTIETCEVRVLDTENGLEGEAKMLSGGQRVLVGEAVSLGLAMLACRRSGLRGVTLVRDETGAALDRLSGPTYIAMLRRAADIVDASHVLYVTHNEVLRDLADAKVEIKNGAITVTT